MSNSNFISVDSLYYAVQKTDSHTGATYGAVKPFAPVAKISIDPSTNVQTYYADGVAQGSFNIMGEGKISVDVATVSLAVQADIFGHSLDGTGGIIYNKNDWSPCVCLFYRRLKTNGHYRYIKVYRCKFIDSKDDAETETNNVKIQNDVITGTFYPRIFDGNWKNVKDEDEDGYVDVSSTWFAGVDSADVTSPEVTSTIPAANATAVTTNTTYQWAFSESIAPSTILSSNFYLIKDADGSIVGATVAYNDTTKTVTLTPSGVLSSASKYLAVVDSDVTDLAGNHLVQVNRLFTTA